MYVNVYIVMCFYKIKYIYIYIYICFFFIKISKIKMFGKKTSFYKNHVPNRINFKNKLIFYQ